MAEENKISVNKADIRALKDALRINQILVQIAQDPKGFKATITELDGVEDVLAKRDEVLAAKSAAENTLAGVADDLKKIEDFKALFNETEKKLTSMETQAEIIGKNNIKLAKAAADDRAAANKYLQEAVQRLENAKISEAVASDVSKKAAEIFDEAEALKAKWQKKLTDAANL